MRRLFFLLVVFCLQAIPRSPAETPARARHVVLMVWDGMRPDFIRAELTPNLWALAQHGVFFKNHHAVFMSSTEVNGTALATGALPRRSGIIGNREFRPVLSDRRVFDTQDLEFVTKGDALTEGRYIALPTIAAQLQAAGLRTIVASTKAVGLLQDRPGARRAETIPPSVDLYTQPAGDGSEMRSVPAAATAQVKAAIGPFPSAVSFPNTAQDAWTVKAVTDYLWKSEVPVFTMIWLSEPDYSQHQYGLGSEPALAAMRSSDENLGRVVEALKAKGQWEATDILVVSDHGFSTIERSLNVSAAMRAAGFDAVREFSETPKSGQVVVAGNGGTILLYVIGRNPDLTRRVVEFLQTTDFAGPIFTRSPLAGTFALADAAIDSADAPDVVFSMRWSRGENDLGVPGLLISDGSRPRGAGMHVSMSAHDMHNTLVAAGPDFREALGNELPSGNIDVAPTILQLLKINPAERMDGRVLWEGLRQAHPGNVDPPQTNRATVERDFGQSLWRQYLKTTRFDGVTYLDEGGATSEKKQAPKD
jgi:predicted AlkP superfamily pyrophosphatase or phosphodiesterase